MKIQRIAGIIALLVLSLANLSAREFTVLTYNVENLFDADGVAAYKDYEQGPDKPYGPKKLLGKLRNITKVLKKFNDGKGPEVIAFQEFEFDVTPAKDPINYTALLKTYTQTTVEKMLTTDFTKEIATLPVEFLLLKYIVDSGLEPYTIATKPSLAGGTPNKPQTNVIFSRFPIKEMLFHNVLEARDILEVQIDIDGNILYVFDNHWKSNRGGIKKTEEIRIQNAEVLRKRVDELLAINPSADIILAGDFNSHYNQVQRQKELTKDGINSILLSQGNEEEMLKSGQKKLYNLWYELPREKRKSDFYDNQWGTLMNMMITSGLYDQQGIQYVDNSFTVAVFPGLNILDSWELPIAWHMGGEFGGGFSDHFPIYARFRTVDTKNPTEFVQLVNPGKESPEDVQPLVINFKDVKSIQPLKAEALALVSENELPEYYGQIFEFKGKIFGKNAKKESEIKIGEHTVVLFSHDAKFRKRLYVMKPNADVHCYGQLGEHGGKKQLVLLEPEWLLSFNQPNEKLK